MTVDNPTSTDVQKERESISRRLCQVIVDANAYDPQNQFINIDAIWAYPKYSGPFSDLVFDFVKLVLPVHDIQGVVSIDNILFPYGPIPIATLLSTKLDLPLAIWKENADPITGLFKIYGQTPVENGLLVYDVTRFGLTALRALHGLHINQCRIRWLLTIVDCEAGAAEFLKKESLDEFHQDLSFLPIVSLEQVTTTYQNKSK